MKIVRTILIAAITAPGLSACGSSQPSNQEAQDAITTLFTQASNGAMTVTGFRDFKLTGCHKADPDDGVVCDVGGSVVVSIVGTEQVRPFVEPVRFSKASGTWTAHKR
ncbi:MULTISPECIES: hypothetical protein [Stenotrophomonas]|uniref:Lipoprotein n=1 Tax=Stenotrophomonas maltophilia TaxID=40324 RepID=A0A3S0HSA7_STEMA|nr:hypothetical protein [Stenotrophomonas maltophilia]RTQ83418.1 hypothetical protein EKL94_21320 [Stenotrophomonas maltophilia]